MRRRDPTIAGWLSIVPGLGQAYNGQFRKAVFFPIATLACILGSVVLISSGDRLSGYRIGVIAALLAGLVAVIVFMCLFVLGLAFWASSVVDARRSARDLSTGTAPTARWWLLRL